MNPRFQLGSHWAVIPPMAASTIAIKVVAMSASRRGNPATPDRRHRRNGKGNERLDEGKSGENVGGRGAMAVDASTPHAGGDGCLRQGGNCQNHGSPRSSLL